MFCSNKKLYESNMVDSLDYFFIIVSKKPFKRFTKL